MNKNTDQFDYLFKILLIGNSGVGKSSMMMRFIDDEFFDSYISTIGVDFKIKTLEIDGKIVKLQIWDTAGQERFRTITNSYYRGAHGIIMVYDITDAPSFHHIKNWMTEISNHACPSVNTLLVGNKCDLEKFRTVSTKQAQDFAATYDLQFLETSAKTNVNIHQAFVQIARNIKNQVQSNKLFMPKDDNGTTIRPGSQITSGRYYCCW